MELPILRGERLTLRPQREDDLDALADLVSGPTVREWWGMARDRDALREDLRNDCTAFTIEIDGAIAGWLGVWEEPDPTYRHAGLDIALDAGFQDRGLGPEALRLAIDWLVRERGHHRLTIDPAVANERAIRAYERVGFRRVGVLHSYERGPDGTWHDNLLMELLAQDR